MLRSPPNANGNHCFIILPGWNSSCSTIVMNPWGFQSKKAVIRRPAPELGSLLFLKPFRPVPLAQPWRSPREPFRVLTVGSILLLGGGISVGFVATLAFENMMQQRQQLRLTSMEKAALNRDLHRMQALHRASTSNMLSLVSEVQAVLETSRGSQRAFLFQLIPLALLHQAEAQIPASALIAQAIYESGYGQSDLAQRHHNYFGIKAWKSTWTGPVARLPTRDQGRPAMANFRVYPDFEAGIHGYVEFLSKSRRYASAFEHPDGLRFVREVVHAGYCPDPDYVQSIKTIMERHDLNRLDIPVLFSTVASDGEMNRQAGSVN